MPDVCSLLNRCILYLKYPYRPNLFRHRVLTFAKNELYSRCWSYCPEPNTPPPPPHPPTPPPPPPHPPTHTPPPPTPPPPPPPPTPTPPTPTPTPTPLPFSVSSVPPTSDEYCGIFVPGDCLESRPSGPAITCQMRDVWEWYMFIAEAWTYLPLDKMAAILADVIFKCIFVNEKFCILIKSSLKFVPKGGIDNIPALV